MILRCTVSKTSNTLVCPGECFPSLLACRTAIRKAQFSSLEFPALDLAPKHTDAPASKQSKCVSKWSLNGEGRELITTHRCKASHQLTRPLCSGRKSFVPAGLSQGAVGTARLKRDDTCAETRFGLSAKRTSPFKSLGEVSLVDYWQPKRVHLNRPGGRSQFSRLLAAEVCASAVVMLDTPCYEVVWRVLATHSIRQFSPFTSPTARHRVPSHFNLSLQS